MEGLARQRRHKGLPALAVVWGPISDVGVVAASDKLRAALQKLTGVKGMRARDALELLGQALALPGKAMEIAAMTVAPNDGNFNKERLPVLRSPTYAGFVRSGDAEEAAADFIDIRALLQQESPEAVRRKVADVVVRQLAKVLHARPEDISRVRPLGEIGLDSLMKLELVMDLEQALGINVSLVNAVGTLSIPALADEIIAQVDLGQDAGEAAIADIAGRHVTALASDTVERLRATAQDGNSNILGDISDDILGDIPDDVAGNLGWVAGMAEDPPP
jgi:acyl carrier protein